MPDRVLDSPWPTAGGIMWLIGLGAMKLWEYLSHEILNNWLETGMVIGGMIFLIYRIRGQKLDNDLKKIKKKKELED